MPKLKILIFATLTGSLAGAGALEEDPNPVKDGSIAAASTIWSASGGRTDLRLATGLLQNYQIDVEQLQTTAKSEIQGASAFRILPLGTLEVWAPGATADGFPSGRLVHDGGFVLRSPRGEVSVEHFVLQPARGAMRNLELVGGDGRVLFLLDHIHTELHPQKGLMRLRNMDLRLSGEAARALGYPQLENHYLGQAFVTAALELPFGAKGEGTCGPPNWHDGGAHQTDVALTAIGVVHQTFREGGRVVIAPSATLENVGTADVPWQEKFSTPVSGTPREPYGTDQHPFLVWAFYQLLDDGVFRQLAVSQAKHAFFTVNEECSCAGGSVLWSAGNPSNAAGKGCTDIYGSGTNDFPPFLGPREEVSAHSGIWEPCGSFFAPDAEPPGPCVTTNTGDTDDPFERRMVVEESDLVSGNRDYWTEAWYVVRDDVDIFNSMGYRPTTPVLVAENWIFQIDEFANGAAIDAWIPPGTSTASQRHERVETEVGRFSVAADAIDVGGGVTRLVYAVMNYDYDAQLRSFSVPASGDLASNARSFTPDGTAWTLTRTPSELRWDAPEGRGLDWGLMVTFAVDVATPVRQAAVRLQSLEMTRAHSVTSLIPFDGTGRQDINQGMAGAWFEPDTSGQGFLIDVDPDNAFIFIAWFTYDDPSGSKVGATDHRWLTAQGNYTGSSAELSLLTTSGGTFDNPDPVEIEPVGTLNITFLDCGNGVVNYEMTDTGLSGELDIMRLLPGSTALCEVLSSQ